MEIQKPTIFLVDDDEDLCKSIQFFGNSVRLNVECFHRANTFLDKFDATRPGCLLLDVRMPEMSGIQLQAELKSRNIDIPIVFMSGHGDIPMAVQAVKNGAYHFFTKPYNSQELLDILQKAIKRDAENRLKNKSHLGVNARIKRLTPREKEVMELVIIGKTSKVIGDELGISVKTVELHRNKIIDKMDVNSSVELAALVLKHRS